MADGFGEALADSLRAALWLAVGLIVTAGLAGVVIGRMM